MADFATSYIKWVKPIEGGYGWFRNDSGGETYAGIARNYNPTWVGWPIIDNIKKTKYAGKPLIAPDNLTPIKNNTKFPELDGAVTTFYQGLWNAGLFGQINVQQLADILFDWSVNSGGAAVRTQPKETYGIDEILIEKFGQNIPVDSKFDKTTIDAINRVDPNSLYAAIKQARIDFYNYLYNSNPAKYGEWIQGWLNRINGFPVAKIVIGSLGLFIIIGAGLYLYYSRRS
jgi:lysozyme family protein